VIVPHFQLREQRIVPGSTIEEQAEYDETVGILLDSA